MGINQSFDDIEKVYGQKGTDYIVAKYHQRRIYERINDEIVRLNQHADIQQKQDLEFFAQEKRLLDKALQDGKNQVELKRPGALQQAQARHKVKVEQFSHYNQKRNWLENLQKQVRTKYTSQKCRMQDRVREEVRRHQSGNSSLNRIPEYDNHPDNYRRSIENQCIKKHPDRIRQIDATDLERKLTWQNYKQNFTSILNRNQVKRQNQENCRTVKNNITGGQNAVCCC